MNKEYCAIDKGHEQIRLGRIRFDSGIVGVDMEIDNIAFCVFAVNKEVLFGSKTDKFSFKETPYYSQRKQMSVYQQTAASKEDVLLAEKSADYLKTNLENRINLNDLTNQMFTNRNKLSKAFKNYYGMTVFSWLREQRILYAMELLKTTSLTIMQIAEKVGYPDSNNFSTAFRRKINMSPRQYRKFHKDSQYTK